LSNQERPQSTNICDSQLKRTMQNAEHTKSA
jgi:hypothetical protein